MVKLNREKSLLILLVLIGLLMRLPKYETLYFDEAVYANIVNNFFKYNTFLPTRNIGGGEVFFNHPPLFWYIQAITWFASGFNDLALKGLSISFSLAIIVMTYFISKELKLSQPLLPTVIVALSSYISYYTSTMMMDGLFALLIMIYFLVYLKDKNSLSLPIIIFVTTMVRYEGLLLLISLTSLKNKKRFIKQAILLAILLLNYLFIISIIAPDSVGLAIDLLYSSVQKNYFNLLWNYLYAMNPFILLVVLVVLIKRFDFDWTRNVFFVVVPFVLFTFLTSTTIRRLVYTAPLILILSFYYLNIWVKKKKLFLVIVFFFVLSVMIQDYETNYDYLLGPSKFIKDHSNNSSLILSQSGPVISYYSERNYCPAAYSNGEEFASYLKNPKIEFIVLTPKIETLSQEKQDLIKNKDIVYHQTNNEIKIFVN